MNKWFQTGEKTETKKRKNCLNDSSDRSCGLKRPAGIQPAVAPMIRTGTVAAAAAEGCSPSAKWKVTPPRTDCFVRSCTSSVGSAATSHLRPRQGGGVVGGAGRGGGAGGVERGREREPVEYRLIYITQAAAH